MDYKEITENAEVIKLLRLRKEIEDKIMSIDKTALVNYELKLLNIPIVSQRSELLPDFLYEDNGIIRVGVHGDSAVTDEWNDYLKKLGNCG